ncbi:MAG: hypothetical protein WA104_08850 [Thermodesulfovibrionales bacterium]
MGIDLSKDLQLASAAGEEELKPLVYHKSSEVIAILINNKNLTEDLAAIIAGRKTMETMRETMRDTSRISRALDEKYQSATRFISSGDSPRRANPLRRKRVSS